MSDFSYVFFAFLGLLNFFTAGYCVAMVGKPREPISVGHAFVSVVFALFFLAAATDLPKRKNCQEVRQDHVIGVTKMLDK